LRKNFPDWANRRIACAVPPVLAGAPDDKPTSPIYLGPLIEQRYVTEIELPKGYQPVLPGKLDLVEDFGEFHAKFSFEDGVLRSERRLVVKKPEVSVEDFDVYKRFAKAANNNAEMYIPLWTGINLRNAIQSAVWNLPDSNITAAEEQYDAASGQAENNN